MRLELCNPMEDLIILKKQMVNSGVRLGRKTTEVQGGGIIVWGRITRLAEVFLFFLRKRRRKSQVPFPKQPQKAERASWPRNAERGKGMGWNGVI